MGLSINGTRVEDSEIKEEAIRLTEEVARDYPWLDPVARKLQAEDLARERIIEHQLLFEESQKRMRELDDAEIEDEFKRFAKRHGGEKGFLKKFKIRKSDLPKVKREMADDIRFRKYLATIHGEIPEIADEDVEKEYEENKQLFRAPAEYRASHIVFHTHQGQDPEEAKRKAKEALERLEGGESLSKIADEDSDCPGNGGDLGWFPEGQMVEEFESAVFRLDIGERTGVFETPFGYHIARLDGKRGGSIKPLSDVSEIIKRKLESEHRERHYRQIVGDLRKSAQIERV